MSRREEGQARVFETKGNDDPSGFTSPRCMRANNPTQRRQGLLPASGHRTLKRIGQSPYRLIGKDASNVCIASCGMNRVQIVRLLVRR